MMGCMVLAVDEGAWGCLGNRRPGCTAERLAMF